MGSFTGKLGEWSDVPLAERTRRYAEEQEIHPLPDEHALLMSRVRWLLEEEATEPFARVLDVGCHDGFVTRQLATPDFLLGLDPCQEAVTEAERRGPAYATYYRGGFEEEIIEVAIGGDRFDAVVCFEVIEHFTEDEIRDLLFWIGGKATDGARLYFCTPNGEGKYGFENDDPCHLTIFTRESLIETLSDAWSTPPASVEVFEYFPGCDHLMMKVTLP